MKFLLDGRELTDVSLTPDSAHVRLASEGLEEALFGGLVPGRPMSISVTRPKTGWLAKLFRLATGHEIEERQRIFTGIVKHTDSGGHVHLESPYIWLDREVMR